MREIEDDAVVAKRLSREDSTMGSDKLQKFLDAGLFDIGENDERLKIFQDAATALAKSIIENPKKAVSATLVAIDPNVPDNDPVLEDVEAAVRERWKAFRNKYPERPKGLLRPVLMQALEEASSESIEIASVMWLVGINLLPHLDSHEERTLVNELLYAKGCLIETEAEKLWAPSAINGTLEIPPLAFKPDDKLDCKVDVSALEKGLYNASGPHDSSNKAVGKAPNEYWPSNGHPWVYQFVPRASKTIASAIDSAIAPLADSLIAEELEPALKKFGEGLS